MVTTDSVVATATLQYDGTPPSLIVYWGDNTATELRPPPAGSVVLRHAFTPQPDNAKFNVVVSASLNGESDSRLVSVTPRFRVTQHQASFANEDNCDWSSDATSEWRISRLYVNNVSSPAEWYQEKTIGVYDHFDLMPDSEISSERVAGQPMSISYSVVEVDDPGDDDEAGTRTYYIDPADWGAGGAERVDLHFNDDGTCEARIKADIEVQLLKPGV